MAGHPPFVKLIWNAEADALLGAQSDRSIAKLLDVHPQTVQNRRKELGVKPWRMPKRVHRRTCIQCGAVFEIVGGRADRLRQTCPPPKECQRKLIKKLLGQAGPGSLMKRTRGLYERHVLVDK